jgi:hypothetical protein
MEITLPTVSKAEEQHIRANRKSVPRQLLRVAERRENREIARARRAKEATCEEVLGSSSRGARDISWYDKKQRGEGEGGERGW